MKPYYEDDAVTIYHGDMREVEPPNGVPLILTDPPYPMKYQHLFGSLGEVASRSLMEGGSLVTLCGHYQVPDVCSLLGEHLRFWWMAGMRYGGATQRLPGKWVLVQWKPALWYVKGSRRKGDTSCPGDMMPGGGKDKAHHKWGQPLAWFNHWVNALTQPGEVVFDPFMGGGTVLVAAKYSGRRAIGIEIEEKNCYIAAQRCSQGILGLPYEVRARYLCPQRSSGDAA